MVKIHSFSTFFVVCNLHHSFNFQITVFHGFHSRFFYSHLLQYNDSCHQFFFIVQIDSQKELACCMISAIWADATAAICIDRRIAAEIVCRHKHSFTEKPEIQFLSAASFFSCTQWHQLHWGIVLLSFSCLVQLCLYIVASFIMPKHICVWVVFCACVNFCRYHPSSAYGVHGAWIHAFRKITFLRENCSLAIFYKKIKISLKCNFFQKI